MVDNFDEDCAALDQYIAAMYLVNEENTPSDPANHVS
jgi:hypothetical protein